MSSERPILFSAPMVRAILVGAKTQTRRPVNPDLANAFDPPRGPEDVAAGYPWFEDGDGNWHKAVDCCPFGHPGDRLWVRETFRPFPPWTGNKNLWGIVYGADAEQVEREAPETYRPMLYNYERWTPSIHMPRWACRIVLDIVSVRVERVSEITDANAKAEGFVDVMAFKDAWEAMYGKKLGAAMWGWCWVIEFKRAEVPND